MYLFVCYRNLIIFTIIKYIYSMRLNLSILLLIILSVFIVGCKGKKQQIRDTLLKFETTTIELPEKALVIKDGLLSVSFIPSDSLLQYVLYYGPEDCSECAISHLMEKSAIFDLADEMGTFVPIIVFSPVPEKAEELRNSLIQRAHTFPVYIDTEGILQEQGIPEDRLFRSFLLGKQGKPVFVGYPLANQKMEKLFRKVVNNELSSE